MSTLVERGIIQYDEMKRRKKSNLKKLEDFKLPNDSQFRLYYHCFQEEYIGGAHGVIGILY
jgi:hypothetical protein